MISWTQSLAAVDNDNDIMITFFIQEQLFTVCHGRHDKDNDNDNNYDNDN